MSNFTLELLPNDPVMLFTATADYSPTRDLSISNPQVFALLEAVTEPVFYVIDGRQTAITIVDIVQVVAASIRGQMSTFNHPKVRTVVIITTNRTIKMAASSIGIKEAHIHIVSTLEEALDYCRAQVAAD